MVAAHSAGRDTRGKNIVRSVVRKPAHAVGTEYLRSKENVVESKDRIQLGNPGGCILIEECMGKSGGKTPDSRRSIWGLGPIVGQ